MKVPERAREIARTSRPLDWLMAILLSWLLPLGLLFDVKVSYFSSLLLWAVPIALLSPRFLLLADRGSPRRRAFWSTVGLVAFLGLVLDFVLGSWVLRFEGQDGYLLRVPSFGEPIPIEEVLFYILGAWAVLLVYVWCDEYWLRLYSVRTRIASPGSFIRLSWRTAILAVLLILAGFVLTVVFGSAKPRFPIYYSFLVVVAFAPGIALYATVKPLINWQAFSLTSLYVLLTACIWEVTLGLPRRWWDYRPEALLGRKLSVWCFPNGGIYPLEALMVWISVSFGCVLYYEFFRAFFRDPRPASELLNPWNRPGRQESKKVK